MNMPLFHLARCGFGVRRFHTVPVVHTPETVGHHTAGVLAILFTLYDSDPPIHMIRATLYHDVAESVTGDVPATAKWDFPDLKRALDNAEVEIGDSADHHVPLFPEERCIIKFADMFDLLLKASDEVRGGNKTFQAIQLRAHEYCSNLLQTGLKGFFPAHELFAITIKELIDEQS